MLTTSLKHWGLIFNFFIMIPAALFVRENSIYKELGLDCYDIKRDARSYSGNSAVIAHPPCRSWGQLSHFAKPRADEKDLAIIALNQVRRYGGVLEHPRASRLWKEFNLPMGSQIDLYGGFTLSINQSWFGHRAKKSTLLYIVGLRPSEIPAYPLSFDLPSRSVESMSTTEREKTPILFAQWLVDLVTLINKKNNFKPL